MSRYNSSTKQNRNKARPPAPKGIYSRRIPSLAWTNQAGCQIRGQVLSPLLGMLWRPQGYPESRTAKAHVSQYRSKGEVEYIRVWVWWWLTLPQCYLVWCGKHILNFWTEGTAKTAINRISWATKTHFLPLVREWARLKCSYKYWLIFRLWRQVEAVDKSRHWVHSYLLNMVFFNRTLMD